MPMPPVEGDEGAAGEHEPTSDAEDLEGEEGVDSERMHLDEGRVYALNIVFDAIRRNAKRSGQGEHAEAECRSKMQK